MKKEVRSRFAPSPTGFLHIGNLRTALYSYLYAKKHNGKFIVRIEDTDAGRYVEGAVDVIIDTLKEAGIIFDEGPGVDGPYAPYVQSQRKNEYMHYAKELVEKGGAYYCFCTKERLAGLEKVGEARTYDRHCRNLTKAEIEENLRQETPYVIRQKMPVEGRTEYQDLVFGEISVENKELEDQILIKSDGMPTYNFANVVDDHNMDITVVMRGCEYVSSTPKYTLLYRAFGWDEPVYIHLSQIMKDATHKLSKRDGDASFFDFINHGYLKEAVINYIALLGWAPKNNQEKMTMAEMAALFDVEGISKSQSIFDEAKLKWLNGLYIKELSEEEFFSRSVKWMDGSPLKNRYDLKKLCALAQSRVDTLADVAPLWSFLDEFDSFDNELYTNQKLKTSPETAKEVLPHVKNALSGLKEWNHTSIHDALLGTVQQLGVKNGIVLWPARVALSGRASTPGGATELADILGREETLRRLDFSMRQLG